MYLFSPHKKADIDWMNGQDLETQKVGVSDQSLQPALPRVRWGGWLDGGTSL